MPLVERYNDWNISDGSLDGPTMLDFDHRIEADAARSDTGLVNVEDNVRATCVITILKAEFGWTQVGKDWCFDPTYKETDLKSIWRNDLPDCVRYDRNCLKDCFCNAATNPATAYVGPEANVLRNKLDHLEWPRDTTEFVSRFEPAGQYMIGPKFCSAYHLGDGFVGTAGHCLDKVLVDAQLGELRVVFNWVGDVVSKKTFPESEIFEIERVVLCETHGPAPSPANPVATAAWSSRWDTAIFKLKGNRNQLYSLKSAKLATKPPCFGSPVYNIGCPLGTHLKVSANAHVLRHALVNDDTNPFSHKIAGYGSLTTDLDQFEGSSGGPVFDAITGYIVGHTSSTQDAVAESDADAIESWAEEYAKHSKNYAVAADINHILEKQAPNNKLYRVHPKFLRTLSGKPRDSALLRCAMTLCPGDLTPDSVIQPSGKYQAVFSQHHFDSSDVYMKNATGRVDRSAVFMTPLDGLLSSDYDTCILTVHFAGATGIFQKPDASSALIIAGSATDWNIEHLDFHKDSGLNIPTGTDAWSVNLDIAARRYQIPVALLNASRGLIDWTKVRLEQSLRNPPLMAGINLSIRRASFSFPVSKIWPPGRSDVTNNPADIGLQWPKETFVFATTAGRSSGMPQTGGCSEPATEYSNGSGRWIWEAPLDRVWTNPRQLSQGLRDPMMDDVDELLRT